MLLTRVTLCGFKSFCDKVDFDFGPGVTCVVGPNGCGKSNIVDAFKWVLGEQSARALRGRQMGDMIFNGSSTRRSSGVAQVDLVFDNSDHTLPTDHEEVTITRKLYRSGESEYLLNGSVSRLKDIREMFMDTGVGVDAYSVIEQGKVDRLLESSPIERRVIFEEAAGISKYKARKREAQRKLERTNQNLMRVADVIEELEKRLRSVKLQAGKARSFQQYQARLNDLRSTFAMAEYHRFTRQILSETDKVDECNDKITGLRADISRHEAEESKGTLELDRLGEEISQADNQLVQSKSDMAAQIERTDSARKRLEEQQALQARTVQRRDADAERREEARRQFEQVQASASELQQQTHTLHARIDDSNDEDRTLGRELAEAQALLEDEKAGIIDLLRKSAQTHNEIIRLNTHRESLVGQKGRLSERDVHIGSELETSLEQKAGVRRRLGEVEALIAEETARLEEKKAESGRACEVRQRLADELATAKERRSALESRRELLIDMQRKMDGVGAGVRDLLDSKSQGADSPRLDAIIGLVADVFETDVQWAPIIEAALAGRDQDLLVTDSERFLCDAEGLADLPGRLTALCQDRLPPVVNPRDFSDQEGYVARAIDYVRYDDKYESLARVLFGKTIIVESLEVALRLAKIDVDGHRFVTRRCEVVLCDGRISVGPAEAEVGLISRRSELRDIEEQLVGIQEQIAAVADRLNRTDAQVGHLDTVQQELRTAIYESSTARVELKATLQGIAESIDRLAGEKPLIAQEVTFLEQQINEAYEKSAEGGRSLEVIERDNKLREQHVADHVTRIDAIIVRREDVQARLTEAKVSSGQLTEKRAAAAENINALRRTIHELDAALLQANADIEQCEAKISEAEETIATGHELLVSLEQTARASEDRAASLRSTRDQLRLTLEGLVHSVKAARADLSTQEAALHEHEMSVAQTSVRRDDLVARIQDEMGVNLSERYVQYEHEEQDWEAVEVEITELRAKMDRLGNVNLDAISELAELDGRHSFLASQRDDLNESIRRLGQLIDTLNQESEERFKAAFGEIREHFRALFRKLFGGGRADIVLEDSEDILDCGIEIVAQPPGKELQTISLMSGGEKSLTAIALLMSIFKTRPAPFAILDEVDAALDEANNDRFNRIIQEFVSEAQFIIITHSKRTMAIGDRFYGITMQEPGVSTRVSVQLNDANVA
ncbi:MAG: chromosome segregation protein SMC [Planctomycetes bacterium]|nr:chromosome segregation protein SMC [Planctomycetota bacterium]